MKTLAWTGNKGNNIELRAYCKIVMVDDIHDLDGYIVNMGKKPYADANLELWVDGKKLDSCWDINFWRLIDAQPGIKKVWGLKVGMSDAQAVIVDAFLKDIIESGKSADVVEFESAKNESEKAERKAEAQKIVDDAAKYTTPLMTDAQYKVWAKNYNNVVNEGGDGYVPHLITIEQLAYARKVLAE